MTSKIRTRQQIKKTVENLRKKGKRIVTINGSFDILHVGHIRMLQEAKAQGDVLIVGLNSDSSVRGWKKKIGYKDWRNRPFNSQRNRAEMLAALESVDYVTVFPELVPIPFIESIRPDVHVNGSDYGKNCIEASAVKRCGGRVHIAKLHKGLSTSNLIQRILQVYKH